MCTGLRRVRRWNNLTPRIFEAVFSGSEYNHKSELAPGQNKQLHSVIHDNMTRTIINSAQIDKYFWMNLASIMENLMYV